ncbi:MAG TPA: hypothetical protein VF665_01830 [Longimicrobium sp.]|jgi:hypothetical protein|uniref:hypothetical protein n=1 Tax=Longimicrobium sp. TaxID=2029185 RepID=UPI002ED7F313
MRLDPDSLEVQSFSVAPVTEVAEPSDTGQYGPRSYCWICYNTDDTVPSCGYKCLEPDTFVNPACTWA